MYDMVYMDIACGRTIFNTGAPFQLVHPVLSFNQLLWDMDNISTYEYRDQPVYTGH